MSALNAKKTSVSDGGLFAIVDERVPSGIEDKLSSLGFSVIRLPKHDGMNSPIASHTDIILYRHMDTLIGSRAYFESHGDLALRIRDAGFRLHLSHLDQESEYPFDALFNALVIGDKLFCNLSTVCPNILGYASIAGLMPIPVKQGYPACTVLPISDKAAVTADRGMAKALEENGITVLLVDDSEKILLPPYKNGFIGGAAGVFEDKIFFLGNYNSLPYAKELSEFAARFGLSCVSLDESLGSLLDLGGIILHKKSF